MKKKLKILYDGGRIDRELDDQIRAFAKTLGWKFTGSSLCFVDGERDICFEKEENVEDGKTD